MAEEATTQSAEPAQNQSQSTEASPNPLEKVYETFNVENTAASFQPQPPVAANPAPTPPTIKAPDPFDPNFGAWQQGITGAVATVNHLLQQTSQKVQAFERDLMTRKVEADIKQAVGVIAKNAGIDPDVAEVHLEVTARKDPKFKSIWENRDKNPQAFEAAIKAVSALAKEKFTVRQDPQLAENQRAMKVSQQQMATTTKQSDNEKWESMTPAERQREVQKLLRLGGR